MRISIAPCTLLTLATFIGCGREGEQARKEISEAARATARYVGKQAQAFQQEVEGGLKSAKDDLADLDERAERLSASARERWQKTREDLREKQKVVAEKLEQWKQAGGEAAEKAGKELDEAWKDLKQATRNAKEQLDENLDEPQ